MATKHKMTTSVQPVARRPSPAEQRAAQAALLSDKMATLKQEAAERRAQRDKQTSAAASAPPAAGRGKQS